MLSVISRTVGVAVACLSLWFSACSSAPRSPDPQAAVNEAESSLAGIQNDPEMKSLRDSMREAKAVVIVMPGNPRAVALARDDGKQAWYGPAFYTVTRVEAGGRGAGPFGFTAGEQNLDLLVLAMTSKAVNWLLSPTLPGKGELNIAAGGPGSTRGAADMVVFDRSKASGGGSNLEGTIFSIDQAANQRYYGKPVTPDDILVRHSVSNPAAASLRKTVAESAR